MERESASCSYNLLMNMVTCSRKVYERLIANGADVHQFYNKYQTTIAALQLVRMKLDDVEHFSDECVETALSKARPLAYDFVKFVGEKIKYYGFEEVSVSETRW